MKNKIRSTKDFVCRHRVAIAVTGTAVTCVYLHTIAMHDMQEFLVDHNLYEQYLSQS